MPRASRYRGGRVARRRGQRQESAMKVVSRAKEAPIQLHRYGQSPATVRHGADRRGPAHHLHDQCRGGRIILEALGPVEIYLQSARDAVADGTHGLAIALGGDADASPPSATASPRELECPGLRD